ncbi:branched-chain alpha-keto acid dehydrogenase subunit E2 [Pseudovibrio sp. FO-BEG1]|uniref:Pyruvate dehydrogenase E2 component (Dihydrolipoamide acetyltransferase) n=2 Tax=Pseudovibrio TaxID=258255 RepID=A0A1I7AG79_9HYPH|nr:MULTISPECIES: alpha/beta fold hydrolase [Pseudovibrio]AEV34542.1 branched-chain alpha-keto acid dehydrogenase subunit E2 [Pseudovibrio sp. FO-BEG1]EEA93598.1 dihydrolipoyllysine-residue acetyltransferase component of acetoin cleaving system, putative [Pseudovibrio sp. JE062]QUS55599.1 alpha/beta fold hydrolase [Pseudovibrio brasiliensis]SFT73880.1 pyruvate dehydrogenase E2 component (dihydrolipoamide acetyltransferase) [Pseudovibrio denitrificans]
MNIDSIQDVTCLPFTAFGPESAEPIIFIHGFGGDASTWRNIQVQLENKRRTIAFDLPAHGRALADFEPCNAVGSAKAVVKSLDALKLDRVHLVGHSMGGAIAALIAMRSPERIASLTLLAPGGFGPEINAKLLRRYAVGQTEAEQQVLLEQFVGLEFELPRKLADYVATQRSTPGAAEALKAVSGLILEGESQGVLPTDKLGELPMPIKVVWGTQDKILPTRQCHKLPGPIACHVFDRVGHMVHMEIPQEVIRLILENTR